MSVWPASCSLPRPQPTFSAAARSHLFGLPQQGITPRAKPMAGANAAGRQYHTMTSLRDLPDHYSACLLDQFGVLHDGEQPYPGAIEAVKYLANRGMKLLIISNSSRRSSGALGNLGRMGFPVDAFCGAITSGEVTHQALLSRATPFWQQRQRCVHFTWGDRGAISLEGLTIDVTQDPTQADFILAHGTEALGSSVDGSGAQPMPLEEMRRLLESCAAARAGMPMVVANPDVVTVSGTELRTMPGTLAQWYAAAGGEVVLMGKPASVIYDAALGMLGLDAAAVVAIGDSLEHDIAGAARAGIDAVFVAGGIHAAELKVGPPEAPQWEPELLGALCGRFNAHPRYALPYFAA